MKTEIFKVGDKIRIVSWKTAIERSEKQKNFRYRYSPVSKSIYGMTQKYYEEYRRKDILIIKTIGMNICLRGTSYNWPPFCLKKVIQ